jgi:enoyl-CoA hydratase
MKVEWANGVNAHIKEGATGAALLASGIGWHGDFKKI